MNYLNIKAPYLLFQEIVNDELYVDKSLLIEKISKKIRTNGKYICITRPRRFGKTINAAMLGAYYTLGYDSQELFHRLAIEQTPDYKKHLNKHNVIYIDFSQIPDLCEDYREYLISIIKKIRLDIKEYAPNTKIDDYDSLSSLFTSLEENFIFILDEWDSIFYKKFMTEEGKQEFLQFLKGLFKDQPYAELVYMTGVLPITKYSIGSELNMFDEYNFINDTIFDHYFGFYEDEVKELCKKHPTVSYEEIKLWYDGYHTSNGKSLFNPRSVNKALTRGICLNYWTETGPMNEIADCIEHNIDEVRDDIIKLVAGICVEIDLKGYSASEQRLFTRDEILSAMVIYGFLSYHDRMLQIPNYELMEKFQSVLSRESFGSVKEIIDDSKKLLEATLSFQEQTVAEILESIHDKEIPILKYNDENSLSCVITLSYLYARNHYWIEREMHTGKGYCDFIFFPKKHGMPGIIIELKMGHSCKEAIRQIKNKNYMQKLSSCKKILLVGINYNKKKHHECKIESYDFN